MNVPVTRGTRYAIGARLPFFVSKAMVASWAKEHGFVDVKVRDRSSPLGYDAKRAPSYSDDWGTAIEATYTGTAPTVDVPGKPAWVLVLERNTDTLAAAARAPAPKRGGMPGSGAAGFILFVLLLLAKGHA